MCSYISSADNRIYAGLESAYGSVPAISDSHRIPAISLAVQETREHPRRRDKTGGRTFVGLPAGMRRQVNFALTTYMTGWANTSSEPAYGALFRAAMGADPLLFAGGTVASVDGNGTVVFTSPHGLAAGQAIAIGGEMRFVTALVNSTTVTVNAPFASTLPAGEPATATVTYKLGRNLPSVSLFDYWSPAEAPQRLLPGAGVDELKIAVNGDFHQFEFRGPAKRVMDSATFNAGDDGLAQFPQEPAATAFDYSIVPGHLGQVWLGATPNRFYTLIAAEVRLQNAVESRDREFGLEGAQCIMAAQRTVSLDMELYARSDTPSNELFQAARQTSPIAAMLQLGQQMGSLFGAYLKSVVPESPAFDDREARLRWRFKGCRAQGTNDDEMVIGIG